MDDEVLKYLTKEELKAVAAYSTQFNRKAKLGRIPAVVAVDFTRSFVGIDAPFLKSVKVWPKSAGAVAWRAMRKAAAIVAKARRLGLPIYYTIPEPLEASSGFGSKTRSERNIEAQTVVMREMRPRKGDRMIHKFSPSGFFGTNMPSLLVRDGVDTLIVTGGTTSGCVRATVVDAASYHLNVLVVKDATFDRFGISHKVNLFDMRAKYADLVTTEEVLDLLDGLKAGGGHGVGQRHNV